MSANAEYWGNVDLGEWFGLASDPGGHGIRLTPEMILQMGWGGQDPTQYMYNGGDPVYGGTGDGSGGYGNDIRVGQMPGGGGGGGRANWLAQLLGGGGGGGGGRGGGGRLGFLQQNMEAYRRAMGGDPMSLLMPQVLADASDTSVLTADPRWQDALFALNTELAERGGRLADLDPESIEQLEAMRLAEQGAVDQQIRDANEQVLARAFGSGLQQSTVLGDATGRVAAQSAQLAQGVAASDAQRRLALRQELAQQYLQSADIRRSTLQGGADINLADVGMQADQIAQQRALRAGLLEGAMGRSMEQVGLAQDAEQFQRDIGLRRWQTSVDAALQQRSLGIQSRELAMRDRWFQNEQEFQKRQFDESIRQWNLGYQMDREAMSRGIYEANRARSDAKRSQWLSTFAVLVGAFASDARLKTNVRPIMRALDVLSQIEGVTWDWKEPMAHPGIGVLAQDVEKVLPDAVTQAPDGTKLVFYHALIPVLVEAVKELAARVARLEEAW